MIDENDAPEGYKAEGSGGIGCHPCALLDAPDRCDAQWCMSTHRADKSYVIFVKRDPS